MQLLQSNQYNVLSSVPKDQISHANTPQYLFCCIIMYFKNKIFAFINTDTKALRTGLFIQYDRRVSKDDHL